MSIFGGGAKSTAKTPTRAMGLDLQSAQYGAPIPVVFGQNKVAGNVIWYGDFQAIGHQQKQPGKGGGGGSSGTTYTYSSSYMLGLCEGQASVVNVYDGSSVKSLSSVGGIGFTGTLGQAPWAHLSGAQAIGYSGTALAAFQNKDLGSSASLPNYNFEMAARNQFGGGIVDANPADIVTAICTDTQIGVSFNALGDLTQFKNYCTAAGIFFSPVYATQQTATQTLDDLFKYSNSAPFFSEGKLKVAPYGDATITGNGVTFTPNVTAVADLGRDDFITNGPGDPVTMKRIGPADAMNIVRVEYKDRANTYHTGTVIASIDQDVVGTGARADQSESVDMITTAPVARLVAQNLLQRTYYIRNTYEFQLSWRYCYLEPMDVVTLTDANTGLYLGPVRIIEIGEDEHGLLSAVAEEFPDGVSHGGIYATQANAGATVDTNADPGAIDGPYLFRGPGFLVSNNQPEIWCALSGNDPMWAGCDVYLSQDGTSYTYLTTHSRRASYGLLTNTLPSVADPDTTSAPNVVLNGPAQLLGGTRADADQFITLAMFDQEIIAYQTATLASGPSYTLGYLRRGGYGSAIAAHTVNAPFVRLDENILRIPVDPSQIGQTVYLKFVSFNVFGKGGRTLADETAYAYVVGTNVELPDVPLTPSSFTATGVADGVSLTWTNPNPAAVGCTSIEYATASGGPWTVLAQVGPTTTAYAHHFTTGATYFYRARSRGPLVAAGFSSYTATVSNTGTNVGAISGNATTAIGQVTQLPVINGGFDIAPTGYGWTADSGTAWIIDTGSNSPGVQPNCARHTGTSSPTTGAYRNNGLAPCQPGQVYKTQALIKAVSANGACYVYISWCNAGGGEIGTTVGNSVTGTTTAGSYAIGIAPAGTVFARTCLAYSGQTTGNYYVDNVVCTQYPSSIDEVPDGTTNARTLATRVSAGKPVIDFSEGIHFNKQLDNIGDGTTYGRPLGSRLNAGNPLIDFSAGYHLNKNIDNLADGATYIRNIQQQANGSGVTVDNAMFQMPLDASGNIPGWVNSNAASFALQSSVPAPNYGTQYAVLRCGPTSGSGRVLSARKFVVRPGDNVSVGGIIDAASSAISYIQAIFYNSSDAIIGSANASTSSATWQDVVGSATAPSGTTYMRLSLFCGVANAYAAFNFVWCTINDVRVAGGGTKAYVDFTDNTSGGHNGKNVDNVGDGATYGRPVLTRLNAGNPLIDFGAGYHLNKNIDNIGDGTTYGRVSTTDLSSNRIGLRVAGSGQTLGNQLNAPNSLTLNYGAARTATACTATSAGAVSINAFSINMGGTTVSYNAVSNAITGLTVGSTYQIYCRDAGGTGGTKTWFAYLGTATGLLTLGDDIVLGGRVTIPSSGSSGGGGTGTCPLRTAWCIRRGKNGRQHHVRAGSVRAGDFLLLIDGTWGKVTHSVPALASCVRMVAQGGTLGCSEIAPIKTFDSHVTAHEAKGRDVLVRGSSAYYANVSDVVDIGERWVQHITCENAFFWVGDSKQFLFGHHNLKP